MESQDMALAQSGCDQVKVEHRPRLLSDSRPLYTASDLADYLEDKGGPVCGGIHITPRPKADQKR